MVARERKTGPGYAYILCDVCGSKIRQKDAVLITDKYNTYFGLLVCKKDAEKTNPQAVPFSVRETQVQNPKLLRSEMVDQLATNTAGSSLVGAVKNLIAEGHPLNDTILLQWIGPDNVGSDPILGYLITRATPQDAFYVTVADTRVGTNGNNTPTYYEDTESPVGEAASYIIYALNKNGVGAASAVAYYPNRQVNLGNDQAYLAASQNTSVITTSDGRYITVAIA